MPFYNQPSRFSSYFASLLALPQPPLLRPASKVRGYSKAFVGWQEQVKIKINASAVLGVRAVRWNITSTRSKKLFPIEKTSATTTTIITRLPPPMKGDDLVHTSEVCLRKNNNKQQTKKTWNQGKMAKLQNHLPRRLKSGWENIMLFWERYTDSKQKCYSWIRRCLKTHCPDTQKPSCNSRGGLSSLRSELAP